MMPERSRRRNDLLLETYENTSLFFLTEMVDCRDELHTSKIPQTSRKTVTLSGMQWSEESKESN